MTFDPISEEPYMVPFGVFDADTKRLLRTGLCMNDLVQDQAGKGEVARVGVFKHPPPKPPVLGPREKRRQAYPTHGEQLSAIVDLAKAIRDGSEIELPDKVLQWLENVDAVKAANPKE